MAVAHGESANAHFASAWSPDDTGGTGITACHVFTKAKGSKVQKGDKFSVLMDANEYTATAIVEPPVLSCNIQSVEGAIDPDCPVLMTTQYEPQAYAVLSGKINKKLADIRPGEKHTLMSMITA